VWGPRLSVEAGLTRRVLAGAWMSTLLSGCPRSVSRFLGPSDVLNRRAKRSAVSAVMPQRSRTMSFTRLGVTLMARATALLDNASGCMNSARRISPGWMGEQRLGHGCCLCGSQRFKDRKSKALCVLKPKRGLARRTLGTMAEDRFTLVLGVGRNSTTGGRNRSVRRRSGGTRKAARPPRRSNPASRAWR